VKLSIVTYRKLIENWQKTAPKKERAVKLGVARGKEEYPFSTFLGHVQFDLVKFSKN
jgi:hypothetical protein